MFLQPSGRKMYVYNLLGLGEYKSQVDARNGENQTSQTVLHKVGKP